MTEANPVGPAPYTGGMDTDNRSPVVLIIRDGWGTNPHPEHDKFNAVKLAQTPVADRLMRDWPSTHVITCGEDVGLPRGTMGNSEVGHQNIGAGRIVDQEIMRITRAIRDGSFFDKPAFLGALQHARQTGGALHLLGLLSNGQVHSDIEHLYALIDLLKRHDFPDERAFIHVITDGRDVGPTTGLGFVKALESRLVTSHPDEAHRPRIASVCGRYYAMDRDNRWERVARAYAMLTGHAVRHTLLHADTQQPAATSATEGVQRYYDHPTEPSRTGDEFILPTRIVDARTNQPLATIKDGDAVIFFNFRGDRPREIVKAFMLSDDEWKKVPNAIPDVGGFDRGAKIDRLFFASMSNYEQGLPVSAVAFDKPPKLVNILGEVVSKAGLTQFRCAETEKFPHVTFFFNDYREQPFPGEKRELIPSPREVTTYDQKPEMSAPGVCEAVLRRLSAPPQDCEPLIVVNFANPDMVGHTGKLDAAIKAVETVDACVGRIVDATLARGGSLIITADHGNAEQMWDPAHNCPHTSHTTYDVPLMMVSEAHRGWKLRSGGRLADIAPTVLMLMGLEQPKEMTGQNLLTPAKSRAAVAQGSRV
jgi:2,3-bisphosphoglycerate-independent phosphoglycerate mutase